MRGRVICTLAVGATLAAGCGGGSDRDRRRPASDKPARELRLHPFRAHLVVGRATRLEGRLLFEARRESGQRVSIEADPWPYDRFRPIGTVTTRRYGLFMFPVRPARNTRYRAVAAGVRSDDTLIRVWATPRVRLRVVGAPRVEVALTIVVPPGLPVRPRVEWYAYQHSRRHAEWRRVARGVARRRGRRLHGTTVYEGKSGAQVAACYDGSPSPALGGHWLFERLCGDERVDERIVAAD